MHSDDLLAYNALLSSKGISLVSLGAEEKALERESALLATRLLESALVPILGGDVYFQRGQKIVPAYANWHCERLREECDEVYARRCGSMSRSYIERFPTRTEDAPIFVLVTG